MTTARKLYPSDVSDEDWALVAPYLTLLPESGGQREHPLREACNGLRYVVKNGILWRAIPNDLSPWQVVYDQARRRLRAGCFVRLAHDLRAAAGRAEAPSAAVLDSRTLRGTPESGRRAGWDGHKRTRDSKLHLAVDTLGHLPALRVTTADEDDRAAVAELAEAVQDATGQSVDLADVGQGDTGERLAAAAAAHGIRLEVTGHAEARRDFVLLPRLNGSAVQRVAERSFAWMVRCRRLARDYERLPATLAGLHVLAFVILMLRRAGDFALVHNSLRYARHSCTCCLLVSGNADCSRLPRSGPSSRSRWRCKLSKLYQK